MRHFILAASLLLFGSFVHAGSDRIDQYGILRFNNGGIYDGTPHRMVYAEASYSCPLVAGKPTQLPSIRDLALASMPLGSKDLLEYDDVDPNAIPKGYYLVDAVDRGGKHDRFYFNGDDLKPLDPSLKDEIFWSSSSFAEDLNQKWDMDSRGLISPASTDEFDAVRCLPRKD